MPVIIDTSGNNSFPVVQVGDILYGLNFWGTNLAVNPDTGGSYEIPCGAQISGNCYELPVEGSAEDTGVCKMCYTMESPQKWTDGTTIFTEPLNDTSQVQAYPNMLFGSAGGRNETWGVACGTTPALSGGRCKSSPLYDLRVPNGAIGLPERVDQIGAMDFCFDVNKNCTGDASNVENVFIDTYLHRIDKPALYPTGYQTSYGDLNKINGDNTETWNLNFKLCLPEFAAGATGTGITNDAGAQGTGGVRINTTPIIIDGKEWAVYFKWENLGQTSNTRDPNTGVQANGDCTNSFFYISFIPWDVGTGVTPTACPTNWCCDFGLFIDWVGSQEFKDRVLGQNGYAPVAANKQGSGTQANWPLWVYQQVGSPPFVVDSPSSYVLDGIQVGNEIWYSPNTQESCVCYENVSFTTDVGVSGKSTREVKEGTCVKASCTAVVTAAAVCDCVGVPSSISGTCGTPVVIGYSLPAGAIATQANSTISGAVISNFSTSGLTFTSQSCVATQTGTINVQYLLNGVSCSCPITVTLQPAGACTVSNPQITSCPATMQSGVGVPMSVTGCCPDATITWSALELVNGSYIATSDVVFSDVNAANTVATALVDGRYRLVASCCDA